MEFLKYFIVIYIFMLSPGPSMALISRISAKFGISKTHFAVLGIVTSITIYAIFSLVGIGALISLYPKAFKVFKICGSFYIIYLGVKIFILSSKHSELEISGGEKNSNMKDYFTGLATDIANPLSFVGLTSVILGFVNLDSSLFDKIIFLILTIISSFAYLYTYAILFGNPISRKFINPRIGLFEKIAGMAVATIGVIFLINTIKI
jgi:threonine/homoserine/homoserine lactone efflux protein